MFLDNERRANFGKRGRARPSPVAPVAGPGPGGRPIVGRPLRGRASTSTTTTEVPEPIVSVVETQPSEEVQQPSVEPSPSPIPSQESVQAPVEDGAVIAQKVSVSSSTTTSESVEPPKRGSAGVLGNKGSKPL